MKLLAAYVRLIAFFIYSAVMLTAIMVYVVLRPGTDDYWIAARPWIRGVLKIFGVTLEASGLENLAPGRNYVVMANHRSQLDPVAMGVAVLPRQTRWVAKKELRRVPILGKALDLTGQIFIDRGDTSSAVQELNRHAGDRDALICFFPEGHRSSTRQMLPFKKGAAAFAISSKMWVLPMAVSGSERCIPNHSVISTPGTIRVRLGKPIDTSAMTGDDRVELTERVRKEIQAMLLDLEGPPPAREAAIESAKLPPEAATA
ncbi:MAG TPA: lysophospholipid acyltransferase family protein [Candidatus Limnocylindrales bacterium]|nr:lysophospholipid acyltransferase family protein [Candidatus Limnocylindrales bacterium]